MLLLFHHKKLLRHFCQRRKTPLTRHLLCQGRIKTLDPRYHPLGGLPGENSKPCISSHSVKFHPVVDLQKAGQHLRSCRSPWTRHETAGPCSGPGNGGWAREDHPTAGVGTAPPADQQSDFVAPQIGMNPASPCQYLFSGRRFDAPPLPSG